VEPLADALVAAGYSVWWDRQLSGGSRYLEETEAELKAAKAVLVVWTKTSIASHWVADEAGAGRDTGRLLPITLDGSVPPLGFRQFQMIDCSRWDSGDEAALEDLLGGLSRLAPLSGEATRRRAPNDSRASVSLRRPVSPGGVPRRIGQKVGFGIIGVLVLVLAFVVAKDYVPTGTANEPDDRAASREAPRQRLPNSVAVLPFTNMSPDPDNAYFASGMHEEILNQLAKLSALNVIARTSVLRYADTTMPIPAIAAELNVSTIMEGSVRYAGNTVRITAQLINPDTGAQLWSEAYQREINDIFAIQADIAMNIANALEAKFSPAEQRKLEQVPTSSPAAYALYLQARNAYVQLGGTERALALLDRAIEIDPEFARAYGRKASVLAPRFVNTVQGAAVDAQGREALEREIRGNAGRALALDPANDEARAALRSINIVTWRWTAFRQAVEPVDELSLEAAELWLYAWMGDGDEAIRIGERMVELDPNQSGPHWFAAVLYAYAGDRAASNRALNRAIEIDDTGGALLPHVWLAYNQVAAGNRGAALSELALTERLLGASRPTAFLPEIAYAYSRLGRTDDVERIVAEMRARGDETVFGVGGWALAYLAAGDETRALRMLEAVAVKARNHEADQGFLSLMNLKMNFLADSRLEEPRFAEVLSRIHGD